MVNRFVQKLQGYADLTAAEILALEQVHRLRNYTKRKK